jgi:hypothetical protein
MADRKLAHFIADEKTGTNVTAAIVVAGAPSTSLWTKWGVEDYTAASKAWTDMVRSRKPPTGAKTTSAMTDAEFVNLMNTYCQLSRENTPGEELLEDGCLAREAHMAMGIRETSNE